MGVNIKIDVPGFYENKLEKLNPFGVGCLDDGKPNAKMQSVLLHNYVLELEKRVAALENRLVLEKRLK